MSSLDFPSVFCLYEKGITARDQVFNLADVLKFTVSKMSLVHPDIFGYVLCYPNIEHPVKKT